MAPRKRKSVVARNVAAAAAADGDVSAPKKPKTAAKPSAVEPTKTKTGRDRQPKAIKQAVAAEPDEFSPMHLRSGRKMTLKTTSKEKSPKKPSRKVPKSPEEARIEKQNAAIQEDDIKTKSVKNIKKKAKKGKAGMNLQKQKKAAVLAMATTAAVDEKETMKDTTTENGRANIDKGGTKENEHNISENEEEESCINTENVF